MTLGCREVGGEHGDCRLPSTKVLVFAEHQVLLFAEHPVRGLHSVCTQYLI